MSDLAQVDIRTRDGGLGRRGRQARGLFAAVGIGGKPADQLVATVSGSDVTVVQRGNILPLSNPRAAADQLVAAPLRDLLVAALSVAGTVCYTLSIKGNVGVPTGPAAATLALAAPTNTAALATAALVGTVRTLALRITATNSADNVVAGAKVVPVVNGADGAEITLAGAARVAGILLDFGGSGVAVQLTMADGTARLTVGDVWTVPITASNAAILAAIDRLLESRYRYEWIDVAGVSGESLWAALSLKGTTAQNTYKRYIGFRGQAPGPNAGESTADYVTRITGAGVRGMTEDGRLQIYTHVRATDPITGVTAPRGLLEIGSGWSALRRPHEPVDAVENGPLPGVVSLYPEDLTTAQVAALATAGYTVARTYPGENGVYINEGRTLAAASSDFKTEERRRVIDRICRLVYERQWRFLNSTAQVNPVTGELANIRSFRRASNQPVAQMARRNEIVAGQVTIPPLQDILATEEIESQIDIVPLGKLRKISTTISFRNPLLDAPDVEASA